MFVVIVVAVVAVFSSNKAPPPQPPPLRSRHRDPARAIERPAQERRADDNPEEIFGPRSQRQS